MKRGTVTGGVPKEFHEWLRSPTGRTAELWQVEVLSKQRFPGAPCMATYDRLLGALATVVVRKR